MGANLILPAGSAAASGGGDSTPAEDPVVRSLRIDGSLSYLERSTGSTDTTWTISFWAKRADQPSNGNAYMISWAVTGSGGSSTGEGLAFGGSGQNHNKPDYLGLWNGSTLNWSAGVYRDFSAWSHYMISCNSGTATVYVNNEAVISNISGIQALGTVRVGTYADHPNYEFGGYLADIICIEGTAKTDATDFIESNGYGGYKPKAYTGSFGTNGWHIDAQPSHDADLLVTSVGRNDGDTTFADAAQGHGLTVSGDTKHSIAAGNPFTGDDRAVYFDGSSDYLTSTDAKDDANFDNSDWTLEFWVNPSNTFGSAIESFMGCGGGYAGWNSSNGHSWSIFAYNVTNEIYFQWWNGSSHVNMAANDDLLPKNTWTHVAVVNQSGTKRFYIGGVQRDTDSNTKAAVSTPSTFNIGVSSALDGKFNGHLYDVSIQSGYCKYPNGTTFTPPTSKITADSNTEFLLQPQKDDSSFEDESSNGHTVSTQGSPTTIASTPYEAAAKSTAMYFDGTGDNLVVTSDSSFNEFGTGDFTIEMWVNPTDQGSGSFAQMFELWDNSSDRMYLRIERQSSQNVYKFVVNGSDSFDVESDSAPDYGSWQHLAVVRNGTSITMYVDGTAQTDSVTISSSASYSWPSRNLKIAKGNSAIGSDADYEGYIFDYRITKGTARYTSDFSSSLPSAPFELNPVYIGGDQSGNKNHFTPTNLNSTDIREDNPFKNHATWNPLIKRSSTSNIFSYSEGNTVATYTGGVAHTSTTIASSGVHYAEFAFSGGTSSISGAGVVRARWNGGHADSYTTNYGGCYYGSSGTVQSPDGSTTVAAVGSNRLGIAFDGANNKADFYEVESDGTKTLLKSLTSSDSIDFDGSATFTATSHDTGATSITGYFEAGEWWGTAPSVGSTTATSLNTSNLDAPTVTPEENFDIALWQGNNTNNRDITGLGFDPTDGVLTWVKNRDDSGAWNVLFDSVRGAGNQLATNETDSELASASSVGGKVSQWNTDGFRVAAGSGSTPYKSVNESSDNYVAWNWKAHQSPASSSTRTTYTVKVEDNSGDAWDYSGSYYDSSTYLPSVYMEIFENRNSSLVSLGKVAVRYYDSSGNYMSDTSEQTYTLECADLNAIAVKWNYDTSGDGQEYDYPNSYNDYLNDQKITILDGTTSEWTTNNHSNDDGTSSNYSPPTGWANGDTLKSATTSYNGSDTATLTSGSGSSGPTEKYNAAAGFTIISYSGDGFSDGDSQTLNHSLGVPLDFVIAKPRTNNQSMGGNWVVWHKDLGNYEYLLLNSNSAKKTDYNSYEVIDTAVSGSQHQVVVSNGYDGSNYHYLNMGEYSGSSAEDYILYGWASVKGMVKVGSWVGNGDDDGPMVYCGFRPSLILAKAVDRSNSWYMWDDQRDGYNVTDAGLWADLSNAESHASTNKVDILSNGFKLRGSGNGTNSSSNNNYIFIAWAHSPFSKANSF